MANCRHGTLQYFLKIILKTSFLLPAAAQMSNVLSFSPSSLPPLSSFSSCFLMSSNLPLPAPPTKPVLSGPDLSRLSHTCITVHHRWGQVRIPLPLPAPTPCLIPVLSLPPSEFDSPTGRNQAPWGNLSLLLNLTINCSSVV